MSKHHSPDDKNQAAQETAAPEDNIVQLKESEHQRLLKEIADYKDRYVRLFAEFENARKRQEREKQEFIRYANEGLLTAFLGILDDLERSVEAAGARHQDYEAFLKGIELVMAHIYDLLKKNDVRAMETVGKKFDPHGHEILMQCPSPDHEDGVVVEEFQKGYYLGDKVIRTAKVKVAVNNQPGSGGEVPSEPDSNKE